MYIGIFLWFIFISVEQVECSLFPEMRDSKLLLRTVGLKEKLVSEFIDQAMTIFKANTVGPQMYVISQT